MPHALNLEKVYQKLIQVACEDGVITEEEQEMLRVIKNNLEKYYKILDESYEDNIITTEEHFRMHEGRKKIMIAAVEAAKADNKVTEDEFRILTSIKKLLVEMEKDEHY